MGKQRRTSCRSKVGKNGPGPRGGHQGMNEIGKELAAWLQKQATRLKRLVGESWKLKAAYLENARKRGAVLLGVEARLRGTSMNLKKWVEKYTDIGYSTALLWKDVAANYDLVEKRFADSNPLEFTLTQVRDAIRDARQEQGRGKPGSGRRRMTDVSPTPGSAEDTKADVEEEVDEEDAADATEDDAPDTGRWERKAAKAEAEAAKVEASDEEQENPALYKVMVMVFTESDQQAVREALSNWSPLVTTPQGSKQFRSLSAHVQPEGIGVLLQRLGQALKQCQPRTVKVSIEL